MRRFIAREDWNDEEYPLDVCTEEAEVMEQEAGEIAQDVRAETAEAERMLDVADSLEDMAVVTDSITEATPAETQLVQIAGDMATAGSDDVTSEDVVPATEAFAGRRIASEAFVEKAKEIWANIKAWLKKVWEKIEKFFYKIFGAIPKLRKEIKAMQERIDKLSGDGASIKSDGKTFDVTNGISGMLIDQKPATKYSELNAAFKTTESVIGGISKDAGGLTKTIETVADSFSDVDFDNAQAKLTAFVDANSKSGKSKLFTGGSIALTPQTVSHWGEYNVDASGALLGGKHFIVRTRKSKGVSDTKLGVAESIRSARMEFNTLTDKQVKLKDEVKFTTLTLSECETLLQTAEAILDDLEQFNRGKGKKDLLKAKDNLSKVCDRLDKEADEDKKEAIPYVRAIYKFNVTFSNAASTVSTQTYGVGLQAIRTVMMLVSRSLAQHKVGA